ncbi:unnamed protein product [Orchesella dallaii]|uniref:Uncharacterized protein n=1 Tax=Orchesella dallaii TaxID=48710 RepID=A0ABP1QR38_9HEXA
MGFTGIYFSGFFQRRIGKVLGVENKIDKNRRYLKLVKDLIGMNTVGKSLILSEKEMHDGILECNLELMSFLQMLLKLTIALQSNPTGKKYLPLFLAGNEKYATLTTKLSNFELKLKAALQKKQAEWTGIEPFLKAEAFQTAKNLGEDDLEKMEKELKEAKKKIDDINEVFQLLKKDCMNIKKDIGTAIQRADMLLQVVKL